MTSSHVSAPEGSSSLLRCPSSLPQHHPSEACLRQMLSEEDRVYQEDSCYRNSTSSRRRPSSTSENASLGHLTVWRERVAQWVYTVIDHVNADRSVVYNVLLLLDAYLDAVLATDTNAIDAIDAATYQLLAMSCLYLVLRLRDNGAHSLSVEQLVSMSRNDASSSSASASTNTNTTEGSNNSAAVVTPARIARTMKSIVQTLEASWRTMVYAPSPGEFVVAYVEQMQHSDANGANSTTTNGNVSSTTTGSKIDDLLHASKWSSILDDAAYLAELSVCDTYLRYDRPSVIAYAALLNVLKCHESVAEEEGEGESTTLRQDLQSLQRLTGCVSVSRTTVRTIYSRLGYVQSQSLDAAMAPTSYSHHDQQGEGAEAANIVPQDHDDEVEVEEEVEEREVVAVAPTAAVIVSAATSPSPSTPSTIAATTTTRGGGGGGGGVKRRISAVVSYDDVSAVVDAALPPAGNAADTSAESSSDSEEEEEGFPMSSSSSSSSSSGMKRVRSYSSDLSSFADPDEASKRMRLVESRQ